MGRRTWIGCLQMGLTIFAQAAIAELPPAPIVREEGGPQRLVGEGQWSSLEIPIQYDSPAVVLLDLGAILVDRDGRYAAPASGQVFGTLTSTVLNSPFTYRLELPPGPSGRFFDVDRNDKPDPGVQIWAVTLANNAILTANEPHLSPVEQLTQLSIPIGSLVTGSPTNRRGFAEPIGGTLLVYAAAAGQGFPAGFGPDGLLFTADDPLVALPRGYTVVRLRREGFEFDRAKEANIPLLERPEDSATDFSGLSYTDSFEALMNLLKARYAYTELRAIDWQAWQERYSPRVAEAEKRRDGSAYFAVLDAMAREMRDAHVQALGSHEFIAPLFATQSQEQDAFLGIEAVELADGRIVARKISPQSPAERAGIEPLSEIVAVNGEPMGDRLERFSRTSFAATPEGRRGEGMMRSLFFAADAPVSLRYRTPGGTLEEKNLTAIAFPQPEISDLARIYPASRILSGADSKRYGYLRWTSFRDSAEQIARFSRSIREFERSQVSGLILDLRENDGGSAALLLSLLSFFWSEERPLLLDRTFSERFHPATGKTIAYPSFEIPAQFPLYAPAPELYFEGPIAILVSEKCASACEFFADWMQRYGRATAIGTRATAGAGGAVVWVPLPDEMLFTYTYTRELDREGLPYIEGRGVQPALRVPLTEEYVRAELEGEDPLLQAAIEYFEGKR